MRSITGIIPLDVTEENAGSSPVAHPEDWTGVPMVPAKDLHLYNGCTGFKSQILRHHVLEPVIVQTST